MTAQELQAALEALGWSQVEVARWLTLESGITVTGQALWRYQHGQRPILANRPSHYRIDLPTLRGALRLPRFVNGGAKLGQVAE